MRKTLAAGLAVLTFGGAVAAAAVPATAEAREWHGGGYRGGGYGYRGDHGRHRGNNNGAAIVAGIAGLAIGAALADSGRHHSYNRGGYGYGYGPGYYDGDDYGYRPYAVCESRHWVWDPYIGRRVLVTSHYEC
ncbi:MAG: hypothetical protein JWP49_1056 [Phenylobacterium sp.]|nr:hypothetical protein [Phenylobacterium sp.]